jgi:hypothetical protein
MVERLGKEMQRGLTEGWVMISYSWGGFPETARQLATDLYMEGFPVWVVSVVQLVLVCDHQGTQGKAAPNACS